MRNTLLGLIAALFVSCATSSPAPSGSEARVTDILGVHLDARRGVVHETLAKTARLEREEKRQEVWSLANDAHYASLIVGYTAEGNVRFVTAVAKPDGVPVHYTEVSDVATADHRAAGETHTYTWTAGAPPHYVIAIGGAERVEYLSLKKAPPTIIARKGDPDDDPDDDDDE
jgi:hypothetical protein